MKLIMLTSVAMLAAAAAQAQTSPSMPSATTPNTPMSSPSTNPSSTEAMQSAPMGTNTTPGATTAPSSSAMTEKMARDKLGTTDYGTVRSLKRNANGDWEAVMRKGSKDQRVTIAADGTVTPNSPM